MSTDLTAKIDWPLNHRILRFPHSPARGRMGAIDFGDSEVTNLCDQETF